MAYKVEFLVGADGQWYWHLSYNGKITCSAQGYDTRWGAKKAFARHCAVIKQYF